MHTHTHIPQSLRISIKSQLIFYFQTRQSMQNKLDFFRLYVAFHIKCLHERVDPLESVALLYVVRCTDRFLVAWGVFLLLTLNRFSISKEAHSLVPTKLMHCKTDFSGNKLQHFVIFQFAPFRRHDCIYFRRQVIKKP